MQTLGNLAVDYAVHQLAYGLGSIVFQRPRRGLHRIGHHQHGCLAAARIGARICEWSGIHLRTFRCLAEVLGLAGAVMLADKVAHHPGQTRTFGAFQTLGDMADYNLGTALGAEPVMGIDTMLIFSKENRVGHLAYVVIHRSGAHQQRVRTDFTGSVGGKRGHGHGMLERARALVAELSQQGRVAVRYFHKGHVGYESEYALYQEHQHVSQRHQ